MLLTDTKRELFEKTPIKYLSVCKLYHVYERRNEWADWSGYTQLVSRSGKRLKTTLEDAEFYAESMRKQGTKFFIDETPALLCQNKHGLMVVTELFSKEPLKSSIEVFANIKNLIQTPHDLLINLPKLQWLAYDVYSPCEKIQVTDLNNYYKRSSSPGHFLCWSLKISDTDSRAIQSVIKELNSIIKA
ncbi:hypothetical protein ACOX9X_20795 [Photobacterium leiognathi subsp. mandapamensis]|uniref:hypothetical protein n=1 Tax=Photobacterium leiognathi TaxID=553611 RepID=UPI003BF55BAD